MATSTTQRRRHSAQASKSKPTSAAAPTSDHSHDSDSDHLATPTHSHSPFGHHHHHHHHHDNVYLTSKNKQDAGVRITRIGLYSNLGMAVAKGVGGYVFHSHAMVADAWHSLTDLASDVLTLATVSWSIKDPSHNFPTGFGKIESLGALGVSGMLLTGGLFMFWSSVIAVIAQFGVDPTLLPEFLVHAHGHSHSHVSTGAPNIHAAWLAAGTVLVKEWLYHATMKVARERKSSVLASNAIHHRVDSWTGIVTLTVILAANFVQNAQWLDPVGGLLISLLVIKAGAQNTMSSIQELVDRAIDDEVKESVRERVVEKLETISRGSEVELRSVSGTKSGQNYLIDLELVVPGAWTVEDVREIEEGVRAQVGAKVRGAKRLRVRFVPRDAPVRDFDEFVHSDMDPPPSPGVDAHNGHAHSHGAGNGNGNGNGHQNGNGKQH